VSQHLKEEVRPKSSVQMSIGDNAPTFCVRQILANTAIAGRSERFTETAIKFETGVAFFRSDESETPGGTFPATRVEMNADNTGSVRPICDGSSLDKIEIAIVFPSQENPNALSLRTGFTQDSFFKGFAELKGEVLFHQPSSGGHVVRRTIAPGFQRSSDFASAMPGIDDDDGRSFQCSGDA
jgi:hypothetical protein